VEYLKGASLGQALASPANIRQRWKNQPGQTFLLIMRIRELQAQKFLSDKIRQ